IAGAGGRFKTRNFAPARGVPEDPATGSAAGPLALHLARHRRSGWGAHIEIRQGAEIGRPSGLHARAERSGERIERGAVGGAAVVRPEQRGGVRLGWGDSRLPQRGAVFQALRKAALLLYYMLPGRDGGRNPAWDAIGYDGPLGRVQDAPAKALQTTEGGAGE